MSTNGKVRTWSLARDAEHPMCVEEGGLGGVIAMPHPRSVCGRRDARVRTQHFKLTRGLAFY
jgi:mannitol/fructose-specific phosphotransferase system IIA component (Ntr-type)